MRLLNCCSESISEIISGGFCGGFQFQFTKYRRFLVIKAILEARHELHLDFCSSKTYGKEFEQDVDLRS